ncbi:MAG TPA: zf-HC2 domain-containing protein [Pyrinomonadaceae bacterium]
MKCEVCLELLEEFLDGELSPAEHVDVEAHLIACADCAASHASLIAEQELFAHYDREVEVSPFLWTRVAAHTLSETTPQNKLWSFAGVVALLLIAIAVGVVYLMSRQPWSKPTIASTANQHANAGGHGRPPLQLNSSGVERFPPKTGGRLRTRIRPTVHHTISDQSDVLSSDLAGLDLDEQDTARHIEQTENLLRSIRNVPITDSDEEIDVTYDKALSRRLLNENVVLRRDAEMKAKFPTKTLLADLEPFLIDIANLPDRARPEDVRLIKERVQKTEIVAALLDYQDRSPNNR